MGWEESDESCCLSAGESWLLREDEHSAMNDEESLDEGVGCSFDWAGEVSCVWCDGDVS